MCTADKLNMIQFMFRSPGIRGPKCGPGVPHQYGLRYPVQQDDLEFSHLAAFHNSPLPYGSHLMFLQWTPERPGETRPGLQ